MQLVIAICAKLLLVIIIIYLFIYLFIHLFIYLFFALVDRPFHVREQINVKMILHHTLINAK